MPVGQVTTSVAVLEQRFVVATRPRYAVFLVEPASEVDLPTSRRAERHRVGLVWQEWLPARGAFDLPSRAVFLWVSHRKMIVRYD